VWFIILGQLNFYLSSHQESKEVRDRIEYQKKITSDLRDTIASATGASNDGEYWYNIARLLDRMT
jgi:hypothetical protein